MNEFDAYIAFFLAIDLSTRHKLKLLLGEDASLCHPFKWNGWLPILRKDRSPLFNYTKHILCFVCFHWRKHQCWENTNFTQLYTISINNIYIFRKLIHFPTFTFLHQIQIHYGSTSNNLFRLTYCCFSIFALPLMGHERPSLACTGP